MHICFYKMVFTARCLYKMVGSPDLRFCFGTVFVTGAGKDFHLQKDCRHIVGKKIENIHAAKVAWKKLDPPPTRMSEDGLEGKNPTKWHWEKGSWRWGLAKIEALQNGSGIFKCFIRSWMHWFDHFLTKLSIYLWIKTGDRHYHFVEPWVIDRPFCRMETVYRSHFVEKGVGSLQNGAPQPHPGNGKEDLEMCFPPQRRALFRHLNLQKWSVHGVFCSFWLGNVLRATTACTFSTSERPKMVGVFWCVLYMLTWKCALRHNCVHFFDIATSKSGPRYILTSTCASRHNGVHFFDISTSKSGPGMVCFVHRATTTCTFSTSQLPKVVRTPSVLKILTSKCVSRHNVMHFLNISTSKSGPALRCFVPFHFEIGFAPQRRATFHLSSPQMSPHPPL